jgi:hypothetical protein
MPIGFKESGGPSLFLPWHRRAFLFRSKQKMAIGEIKANVTDYLVESAMKLADDQIDGVIQSREGPQVIEAQKFFYEVVSCHMLARLALEKENEGLDPFEHLSKVYELIKNDLQSMMESRN